MSNYIVICREDNYDAFLEGLGVVSQPGLYVQATRKTFTSIVEAEAYAATINKGRQPIVVKLPKEEK